jgi:hypothetical protein
VLELDLAAEADRRAKATDGEQTFDIRRYVLAEACVTMAAEELFAGLAEEKKLLFFARVPGDGEHRAYFLLDTGSVTEAEEMLAPLRDGLTELRLHPWWATPRLAQLPDLDPRVGLGSSAR